MAQLVSRRDARRKDIRDYFIKATLAAVATGGLISLAVVAPGILKLLGAAQKAGQRNDKKYYLNKLLRRLEERKLIEFQKNKKGQLCVRITAAGEALLDKYEEGELVIKKPLRWDKRYRLVMFDIKEWNREVRNEIRNWLIQLGFRKLQNSVWIYPYDCQEVVVLLRSRYQLGRDVIYLTVDYLENDKYWRKEFGLK